MKTLATLFQNDKVLLTLEFKVQDCWVGWFWRNEWDSYQLWVCILPTLPVHLFWKKEY